MRGGRRSDRRAGRARAKERFEAREDRRSSCGASARGASIRTCGAEHRRARRDRISTAMRSAAWGIGEPKAELFEMLEQGDALLPRDRPRYLMGMGYVEDIIEAVERGVDLFDCVLPTRNARNGTLFTSRGRIAIKNQKYARGARPLDEACACYTCRVFRRAYLRHLYERDEIASAVLNTVHNLHFYLDIFRQNEAIYSIQFVQHLKKSIIRLKSKRKNRHDLRNAFLCPPRQAPAGPAPRGNLVTALLPFILVFVIFYLLIIMPQRKKQKKHQDMVDDLKPGDRIITTGGIFGTIMGVQPDRIELKVSANVKIDITKSAVGGHPRREREKARIGRGGPARGPRHLRLASEGNMKKGLQWKASSSSPSWPSAIFLAYPPQGQDQARPRPQGRHPPGPPGHDRGRHQRRDRPGDHPVPGAVQEEQRHLPDGRQGEARALRLHPGPRPTRKARPGTSSTSTPGIGIIPSSGDRMAFTLKTTAVQFLKDQAVNQVLETIRNRIDQFGVAEPLIQRQGADRIVVELPGVDDPDRVKDLIKVTAVLEWKLVKAGPARDEETLLKDSAARSPTTWRSSGATPSGGGRVLSRQPVASVTGKDLRSVRRSEDEWNNPAVSFSPQPRGVAPFREGDRGEHRQDDGHHPGRQGPVGPEHQHSGSRAAASSRAASPSRRPTTWSSSSRPARCRPASSTSRSGRSAPRSARIPSARG